MIKNQFFIYLVLIVILILLIIINRYFNLNFNDIKISINNLLGFKKKENYDAKIKNTIKSECGDICNSSFACNGFAYDDKTKNCYLSKIPIITQNAQSVFSKSYDAEHNRCNKIYPIKEFYLNYNDDELRDNTIYSCSDHEGSSWNFYQFNNGMLEISKDDIKDPSNLNVKKYRVFKLRYPNNQETYTKTNILDKTNQLFDYKIYNLNLNKKINGDSLYDCFDNYDISKCIKFCDDNNKCLGANYNNNNNNCCLFRKINNLESSNDNTFSIIKNYSNTIDKKNSYLLTNS